MKISDVISDMMTASEAVPINPVFDWQKYPCITQYSPAAYGLPDWWSGNKPDICKQVMSWFTLYEAQGNAAKNTRVAVKNLRMQFLSDRTKQWSLIDSCSCPQPDKWQYPFSSIGNALLETRLEPDKSISMKPAYPYFYHGYGYKINLFDPMNIRAVFVAMDFCLVIDNPNLPDDRASAVYVVDVGADYYPGPDIPWSAGYAPGIGNGRYLRATNDWRTATLLAPNKAYCATFDEMRANPPPLI